MEKYIIVESTNLNYFKELVNQKIIEGYLPLGGVAVTRGNYVQAMILKE
jgi:hypothetical protein